MHAAFTTAIAAMVLGAVAAPIPVEPFSWWEPELQSSEGATQWMNLVGHNVSGSHLDMVTHSKDGSPVILTHAQMDAIIVADEDPDGPLDYEPNRGLAALNRDPTDRQHVEQIYRVMDANLSRDEIHDLFHSKLGKPIKISDAEVDSAIITHAATAPEKARSDKSFEDSLPRIPKAEAYDKHLELHNFNVSWSQSMAATHKKDGGGSALTEAQEQAIVAADKDPSLPKYEENDYYYDSERHRVKQIFTTMNAGMSLGQIHKLFHSESGKPIRVSDEEVDSAIVAHVAAAAKLAKRDRPYVSDEQMKADGQFADLYSHNITKAQAHAATHLSPGPEAILGPSLTDAQVAAIIAADEDPLISVNDSDHLQYDYDSERDRLHQIYKTLNAGMSLEEIHRLFHSKNNNRPINLTDTEIGDVIPAHAAAAWRTSVSSFESDDVPLCEKSYHTECWPTLEELSH